jgi:hypothetical protein
MHDPQELHDLARKSRIIVSAAIKPSIIKQLWLWSVELADAADDVERRSEKRAPSSKAGPRKGELA